jgi:hypothetical protein
MSEFDKNSGVITAVRQVLLRLADGEEELANAEAARVPYWSPCTESVLGHRAAARVLRQDADRFLSSAETAFSG